MELNNKQTLRTLREVIEKALINMSVSGRYEDMYVFELGSCSYDRDGSNATFKLNVRVKGAKTREEKQLNTFADLDDIDIKHIARNRFTFNINKGLCIYIYIDRVKLMRFYAGRQD